MVAFLDLARVGPDYLPGHAHADTLSFELSLHGQRVFVNGGTSVYGNGNVRQQERGTASHNTVVVNGENSSEIWEAFRVARRAYPFDLRIGETCEETIVSCKHDGYKRLKGKPVHNRTWYFLDGELIVEDKIFGDFENAAAFFHLNPLLSIDEISAERWRLLLPYGEVISLYLQRGTAELVTSFFAPEFGESQLHGRSISQQIEIATFFLHLNAFLFLLHNLLSINELRGGGGPRPLSR